MPEPSVVTAVGIAAKAGSALLSSRFRPAGQVRLGGREERRQTYSRFQEAAVSYVVHLQDGRLSPSALGLPISECKPYLDGLMVATKELAQALYEVRLVGNPAPIYAAEELNAILYELGASFDSEMVESLLGQYAITMSAFIAACRSDLWYQPRWWHLWRASWWQLRWARLRSGGDPRRRRIAQPVVTQRVGPAGRLGISASARELLRERRALDSDGENP